MEKFQNFLRGFGNFMVGMPSKEEVDEIRKNNPQMDIFKTNTQLEKEGKVRNEQGNVVNADTGVITESGNKQSTFSFQDFLNTTGNKIKTDIGKIFKGEKETPEKPERNYLEENKQLLGEIANLSEKARDKAALRTGISNLALSPLIGGQAAMDAAAEINRMTIANMGAMAAQNRVLESNPTKQKIAGKYFR
tara:strand:- start:3 stop:578 length:576 start_codon:yes stop_codon:yes gene_type:complete